MPDGSERKAKSWETSPLDVAKDVSKSLSERIVIAKVQHLLRLSLKTHFSIHHFYFFLYPRWTASCGIWIGHLKSLASSSYLILNTQKEKRSSGILLRMFSERLQRDIMVVICVSVLLLTMDFFTRWLLRNG